jgi:branched-chain amino acid transport system ATP-binding protein
METGQIVHHGTSQELNQQTDVLFKRLGVH